MLSNNCAPMSSALVFSHSFKVIVKSMFIVASDPTDIASPARRGPRRHSDWLLPVSASQATLPLWPPALAAPNLEATAAVGRVLQQVGLPWSVASGPTSLVSPLRIWKAARTPHTSSTTSRNSSSPSSLSPSSSHLLASVSPRRDYSRLQRPRLAQRHPCSDDCPALIAPLTSS